METMSSNNSHSLFNSDKEYAGFWIRFAATLIDGLILAIPSFILAWIIPVFGGFLASIIYKPFFESSRLQGTPGKALLGLVIERTSGERISFKDAMVRYAMSFISSCILAIGYIMAAFTGKKQTLHDLVADTVVVKKAVPEMNYFDAWLDEVSEVFGITRRVTTVPPPDGVRTSSTSSQSKIADKLKELNDLYKQGLITEEEFLNKKADILKEF